MSYRTRIKRLERMIRGRGQVDPDNISGALEFLWSGNEAHIPAALNLAELQAAARMIRADKAAEALGLARLGAVLDEAPAGGDPLGHIAALRPADVEKNFRVFWPAAYGGTGGPTAGDELLARLGLCRLLCIRYQAQGIPAGSGAKL